jgi:hypothetical protein
MADPASPPAAEPRAPLASFPNAVPPTELGADLRRLVQLPQGAQSSLWDALGPSLAESIGDELSPVLDAFCKRHEVDADLLARVLQACRFLIRAAVRHGLDRQAFADDVTRLGGPDAPRLLALLLPGYEGAKRFVRHGLAKRTLAAHGKLVEAVEWRIERVLASNHGDDLDQPLVSLTFRYREGERADQVTLVLTPDLMSDLALAHAKLTP